ncbi:MAG: MFS transporter, partial [Pseudomonadota bacterium]|nr:MFS transporter [Pseudomonadota bacterium]
MHDKIDEADAKPALQLRLIICLGLVAALAPLSIDMYLPSFPTIRADFETSAAQVQLTLSGYMLGFTLGQLGYGPLSDRFGRRPVLLSGIGLFVIMTVLCATANSVESLSVFRFFQAVGGAAG